MRDPKVTLTSLEEDLRNIGLLEESADEELESDEDLEESDEDLDLELEEDEDLEEGRIRRALRGGKVVTQKRTSAKERRKAKMYRKSGKGKAAMRKRARKLRKPSEKRKLLRKALKAKRKGTRQESVEVVENNEFQTVSSLLEDVQNIVSSLDEQEREQLDDAVKAFANVAIISEMLSDFFGDSTELVEDVELTDDLAEMAQLFSTQAEVAAEIAESLNEGELEEGFDYEDAFQHQLDSLIEGLSLYADMTEDEDELEESEEGLLEGDDEDDDDDDDEDDDDDMEESVSTRDKMSAILEGMKRGN